MEFTERTVLSVLVQAPVAAVDDLREDPAEALSLSSSTRGWLVPPFQEERDISTVPRALSHLGGLQGWGLVFRLPTARAAFLEGFGVPGLYPR